MARGEQLSFSNCVVGLLNADNPELIRLHRLHGLCRVVELVSVSCWAPSDDFLESNSFL